MCDVKGCGSRVSIPLLGGRLSLCIKHLREAARDLEDLSQQAPDLLARRGRPLREGAERAAPRRPQMSDEEIAKRIASRVESEGSMHLSNWASKRGIQLARILKIAEELAKARGWELYKDEKGGYRLRRVSEAAGAEQAPGGTGQA